MVAKLQGLLGAPPAAGSPCGWSPCCEAEELPPSAPLRSASAGARRLCLAAPRVLAPVIHVMSPQSDRGAISSPHGSLSQPPLTHRDEHEEPSFGGGLAAEALEAAASPLTPPPLPDSSARAAAPAAAASPASSPGRGRSPFARPRLGAGLAKEIEARRRELLETGVSQPRAIACESPRSRGPSGESTPSTSPARGSLRPLRVKYGFAPEDSGAGLEALLSTVGRSLRSIPLPAAQPSSPAGRDAVGRESAAGACELDNRNVTDFTLHWAESPTLARIQAFRREVLKQEEPSESQVLPVREASALSRRSLSVGGISRTSSAVQQAAGLPGFGTAA